MARIVTAAERNAAIKMMLKKDVNGKYIFSQYEIQDRTNLSRPYIRKLAREIGHQFPRNGVEVNGVLCVCAHCSDFFRRHPSKALRAKNNFCSPECRVAWTRGENHPAYVDGQSGSTFSKWIMNQKEYKDWKEQALARANYRCEVSGSTESLHVHHIREKGKHNEEALNPENAFVVNDVVHQKIHALTREGKTFEEAVDMLKKEYGTGS